MLWVLALALAGAVRAPAAMDSNLTNTYTTVQNSAGAIYNIGSNGTNNLTTVNSGGVLTNISSFYIGNGAAAQNNALVVQGTGVVWVKTNLFVGYQGAYNRLTITNGGRVSAAGLVVGSASSSTNNQLLVTGGQLWVTNSGGTGVLDLRRGTLTFNGGTIQADALVATTLLARINFFDGTLKSSSAVIASGAPLVVGNSTNAAAYTLQGGNHLFADGLVISSNASLRGTGYADTVTLQSGGLLAPGNSPGTLTFSNLTLAAGANVLHEIADTNLYDRILATNLTVGGSVLWSLALLGDVLPADALLTLFDIGTYGAGATTGWLSLGGTNLLSEGATFALSSTNEVLQTFQISYAGGDGNDVTLSVAAIPEPVTLFTLLGGVGALLLRRSFRRARGDT
jgi:hypothetical protein